MKPNYTIDQLYNPKSNSIGFLRLILALMVIMQHSFVLNNELEPLTSIGFLSSGAIGVHSFFILSGFLISSSWINNPNFINFSLRRILRIFPAFWVCLIVVAFIFVPITLILNKTSSIDFDLIKSQCTYLLYNLSLIINQPDILNLTHGLAERSLNGSLWTLSWEFLFYVLLAIVGFFGLLSKRKIWITLLIIICIITYWFSDCKCTIFLKLYVSENVAILPYMFGVGVLCAIYKKHIPHSHLLFCLSVIAWLLDIKYNEHLPLHPFFLSYILMWLMINLPIKSFEKHGDYSYGIYIYHFPIIQIILLTTGVVIPSYLLFFVVLIPTFLMAYLSWKYVEEPSLSLKRYFKKNGK
ncbi:acyltransferase [Pedobacter chinensis]|uniref:Acyltransferase n=1 Tax=Pedobacter chinensis TaxID=2282421 RepID=A0A369PZU8_9SPHI|nr:acyltransferase [Pedobacter chinensis]RDC56219.1 acyltransferase [Pedobacter chinensis]